MLDKETRLKIQTKAESLIQDSKQTEFPIRLSKILEKEHLKVKIFSIMESPEFADYSGMIDKKNKIIYINGDEPTYRKRFTIAHEIGHLLLNHTKDVDFRNNSYSNDPEELEADFFAACLLMPKNIFMDVYQKMNLSELAAFFGVSRRAVGIRADEIFGNG